MCSRRRASATTVPAWSAVSALALATAALTGCAGSGAQHATEVPPNASAASSEATSSDASAAVEQRFVGPTHVELHDAPPAFALSVDPEVRTRCPEVALVGRHERVPSEAVPEGWHRTLEMVSRCQRRGAFDGKQLVVVGEPEARRGRAIDGTMAKQSADAVKGVLVVYGTDPSEVATDVVTQRGQGVVELPRSRRVVVRVADARGIVAEQTDGEASKHRDERAADSVEVEKGAERAKGAPRDDASAPHATEERAPVPTTKQRLDETR